ncbi:hypothetical protein IX51_03155 [uncultured archaeon]|nr:hypothetical protein IX51_03155 [uncultured archaeon]
MNDLAETLAACALSSLISGKVGIRFNQEDPVEIEASGGVITVRITEKHLSNIMFEGIKHRFSELGNISRIAEALNRSSRRLDLEIEGRKIFSMGKGVSSRLGSEKVYFSNILKSFRH